MLNKQTELTYFQFLNETQVTNLVEAHPQLISFAIIRDPDDIEGKLNQLLQEFSFQQNDTSKNCQPLDYSPAWFPSPEISNKFSQIKPLP